MKLTLQSSTDLVTINGRTCRVWRGVNEGGVHVVAFIALLRVDAGDDLAQFERELLERPEPSLSVARSAPNPVRRILAPVTPKLPG